MSLEKMLYVSDEWNVNFKSILLWTVQKEWMKFYRHLVLLTATILSHWVTVRIRRLRHFMVAMMCLTTKPPLHKNMPLIMIYGWSAKFYSKNEFKKWCRLYLITAIMIIIVFKQFCKMYDLESVVDHFVCTGAVYTLIHYYK